MPLEFQGNVLGNAAVRLGPAFFFHVLKADEKEEIEKTDILDWFIKNAERYDNIRILKTKLENAIFDRLSEVFIIS